MIKTINAPIGNEAVHPLTLSYLQWVANQDDEYAVKIRQYREYYEGGQDTFLTNRQRAFLEVGTDIRFRLNAMAIPVDSMAERMTVAGFAVEEDLQASKPQSGEKGLFWNIWDYNRMDAQQALIHKSAAVDGDVFAIVGWDDVAKMPTIDYERAWDGTSGVIVRYDPSNRRRIWYAIKRWVVDNGIDAGKKSYMTVYTHGEIYNYESSVGGTGWVELHTDGQEWPLKWTGKDGQPHRIPVFHAENNGNGTGYGLSELDNLIPVQNALDKVVIDELGVADSSGFPSIFVLGADVPDDLIVTPGSINSVPSDMGSDVKMAFTPIADLSRLSALVEKYITRIAQISRTPLTFFQVTGQVARADTQKAGDSPLVSKVRNRSVTMGNFYEDIMTLCRQLVNDMTSENYEELPISTIWNSFESIDVDAEDKTRAETAKTKAETLSLLKENWAYVDAGELAAMAGYDDDSSRVFSESPTGGFIDDGVTQ